MAKVLIGCYSYDSTSNYGTDYTYVVNWLRSAVEALSLKRATYLTQLEKDNAFDAIFVAPEYMFTGRHWAKKRKPMSDSNKLALIQDIESISNDFKRILIIAGSIFSKEALADNFVAQKKFQANLIAAELQMSMFKKTGGTNRDRNDVLNGWSTGGGTDIPSLTDLSTIANTPKPKSHRVYNAIYAFLDGKRVMIPYNKEWDFKETEGADAEKLAYIPGTSGGLRDIEGFEFGFEICFDHANGALKGTNTAVEFHVLVSDSVDTDTASMAMKNGGYFIHASTDINQTTVYKRSGTGALSAVPVTVGAIQANQTAYWLVDVAKKGGAKEELTTNTTSFTTSGGKTLQGVKLPKLF